MSDHTQPLREQDVAADPVRQFTAWFDAATAAEVPLPEAAALATATADGVPSVRMVLVKRADEDGFVFFSNYDSRKGRELAENPAAALMFHWSQLGRQVRIEGEVAPTTRAESIDYIRSRPRGSQLSALISPQSRPIDGREMLERRAVEVSARHAGGELPLPDTWGGFRLVPVAVEFWQQREDRLHDRLLYQREIGTGWTLVRLAP